jgi:DNA-directed RNA polymerase specialized sigma24 family protein
MHNRSLLEWRQRWNRSLFQFLRRRVRSSVDVQDLAQETYLRLLRARDLSDDAPRRIVIPRVLAERIPSGRLTDSCRRKQIELIVEGIRKAIDVTQDLWFLFVFGRETAALIRQANTDSLCCADGACPSSTSRHD